MFLGRNDQGEKPQHQLSVTAPTTLYPTRVKNTRMSTLQMGHAGRLSKNRGECERNEKEEIFASARKPVAPVKPSTGRKRREDVAKMGLAGSRTPKVAARSLRRKYQHPEASKMRLEQRTPRLGVRKKAATQYPSCVRAYVLEGDTD